MTLTKAWATEGASVELLPVRFALNRTREGAHGEEGKGRKGRGGRGGEEGYLPALTNVMLTNVMKDSGHDRLLVLTVLYFSLDGGLVDVLDELDLVIVIVVVGEIDLLAVEASSEAAGRDLALGRALHVEVLLGVVAAIVSSTGSASHLGGGLIGASAGRRGRARTLAAGGGRGGRSDVAVGDVSYALVDTLLGILVDDLGPALAVWKR